MTEFYGDGLEVPEFDGPEDRLTWIRRRLNTGEAESVELRAAEIRRQRDQEFEGG
ncbi:MAG TPA: hypothetical protein VHQ86_05180 [Candidatus Saccharimonadia bacterium]|nr:hypothetical protein [Candidatus Saccharimonadia bacterium]